MSGKKNTENGRVVFNFYKSYYDVFKTLETDKEKVQFINALFERQFFGTEPNGLSKMANFAYISQKHNIDAQVKGFEDKIGRKLNEINPSQGGSGGGSVQLQSESESQIQSQPEIKIEFEIFWKLYPNRQDKKKAKEKWDKLKIEEQQKIIDTLPAFSAYKPFSTYTHPHPTTYLNGRRWEDEISVASKPPELVEIDLYLSGNHWRFKGTETALAEARSRGWKDKSQL